MENLPNYAFVLDKSEISAYNSFAFGVWRSLVSRLVRDQEASGSNPDTPTTSEQALYRLLRLFCKSQSALMPLLLLPKSNPLRWASIWFLCEDGVKSVMNTGTMKRVTFVYQAKVTLFCFCRNREYHLLESSVRAVWRSGCQRSSGWTIGQRAHRNMMKNTHG